MTDNDEHREARALLGALLHDEPPVTINSRELVRKGRRHAVVIRTATVGTVVLSVVGVVFAASVMTQSQPNWSDMAVPVPSPTSPIFESGAIPQSACNNTDPNCPLPKFTEDHRSRALTEALKEAREQFIPAGLTAKARPLSVAGLKEVAFKVVKPTAAWDVKPWTYFGSAAVGTDTRGFGSVNVYIGNTGTDGRCATLDRAAGEQVVSTPPLKIVEFADCHDENLPGGTVAAVSTYRGRNDGGYTNQEGYRKIVVDAVKPDGSRIRVSVDNFAPVTAVTGVQPTTSAPPLTTEDLLAIVQLPGLKY